MFDTRGGTTFGPPYGELCAFRRDASSAVGLQA